MKYCKRCLAMDTRYMMELDEEGICGGCHYQDSLETIDWAERKKELGKLIDDAKRKARENGSLYDCCVGVSGGKDSTLIACYLKENFDANVLLINVSSTPLTETGIYNVENLRSRGFDMIQFKGNPETGRKLALYSFEKFGHLCKPVEHLMISSVVRTAINFKIPLIVMGENAALVWGSSNMEKTEDWISNIVHHNTILDIMDKNTWKIEGVDEASIRPYTLPSQEEIKKSGIKSIYMQYYLKEYSPVYNAEYSVARGMRGRYNDTPEEIGRYRIFSSIDDDLMMPNEMLKYLKNGFGRASDDACVDLREKRISKEEAIKLIKQFDGKCGQKYIDFTCKYLGITEKYFWEVVDKWVNKKLFRKNEEGKWVPKFEVGVDFVESADEKELTRV